MANAAVFIDGSNIYHRLKGAARRLPGRYSLLDFPVRQFSEWLVKPDTLIAVRYYIGALKQHRDERWQKLYADQQRLIGKLQQQGVDMVFGQFIQHPDKSVHEKGVDVRIAVEMIRYARNNTYEVAYLLSSDTDLVPAVEEVQSLGNTVQFVGFAKSQSFGLTQVANDVRLLRPEDLQPFLPKRLV